MTPSNVTTAKPGGRGPNGLPKSILKFKTGNSQQERIRNRLKEKLTYRAETGPDKAPMLITGPPGVGKSHLANMVRYHIEQELGKDIVCTSYCAGAAILVGGDTLSGLIQVTFDDEEQDKQNGKPKAVPSLKTIAKCSKLEELKANLKVNSTIALLVDEVSMVSPVYLAALSEWC